METNSRHPRQQNRDLHQAKTTHDYLLRGHAKCGYCGSPLVGSFLNQAYRYYHCRGTYSTIIRLNICNAKYIRADDLENTVWNNIRKTLEQPEVMIAVIREQLDSEQKHPDQGFSLKTEIEKLKKQMSKYDSREKRLIQPFGYGKANPDSILDENKQS